jgi:hypothetical protein
MPTVSIATPFRSEARAAAGVANAAAGWSASSWARRDTPCLRVMVTGRARRSLKADTILLVSRSGETV